MGKVRLWLCVYHGNPGGRGELWTRALETDFTLRAGDSIYIMDADEEDSDGVDWTVHRTIMETDGSLDVTLAGMILDPDGDGRLPLRDVHRYKNWWTESDGDPFGRLRQNGWITYAELREARAATVRSS